MYSTDQMQGKKADSFAFPCKWVCLLVLTVYKHVFASMYKFGCLYMQTHVITGALYLASDLYCIYMYSYCIVCVCVCVWQVNPERLQRARWVEANERYVEANTKNCPRCKVPIEKNGQLINVQLTDFQSLMN